MTLRCIYCGDVCTWIKKSLLGRWYSNSCSTFFWGKKGQLVLVI